MSSFAFDKKPKYFCLSLPFFVSLQRFKALKTNSYVVNRD
jgi:hypothetical protein